MCSPRNCLRALAIALAAGLVLVGSAGAQLVRSIAIITGPTSETVSLRSYSDFYLDVRRDWKSERLSEISVGLRAEGFAAGPLSVVTGLTYERGLQEYRTVGWGWRSSRPFATSGHFLQVPLLLKLAAHRDGLTPYAALGGHARIRVEASHPDYREDVGKDRVKYGYLALLGAELPMRGPLVGILEGAYRLSLGEVAAEQPRSGGRSSAYRFAVGVQYVFSPSQDPAGGLLPRWMQAVRLNAGAAASTVSGSDRGESWQAGECLGVAAQVASWRGFALWPGVGYVQKGSRTTYMMDTDPMIRLWKPALAPVDVDQESAYLSVPLTVTFAPITGTLSPYLLFGPRVDVLLQAAPSASFRAVPDQYSAVTLGLDIGVGGEYSLSPRWSVLLEGRYSHDLTDAFDSETATMRNRSFQVQGGVVYRL